MSYHALDGAAGLSRHSNHMVRVCVLQLLNDTEIRELLVPFIRKEHQGASEFTCLPEFAIFGGANRADFAALNGVSHGYEIKSDKDTLERLPAQIDAYSAVFDQATLVSAPRHLESAVQMIPQWWGVIEVRLEQLQPYLQRVRKSEPNPSPNAVAIASLLWRDEALDLLTKLGLDAGVRSKPNQALIERLAERVTLTHLSAHVRQILRARGDWRSAARLRQYGDSSQPPANQSRYRRTPYGNIYR